MKKIIYIMLLTNLFVSYSQKKVIKIEYGITIREEKDLFKDNASLKLLLNKAIDDAKNHSFTLLIQNEGTKFCHNNALSTGSSLDNNSPLFVNFNGQTYTCNDSIFEHCPLIGNNVYILKKSTAKWKITSEFKFIDNYKCYKATTVYTVESPNTTFNHPVVAWFCPDLPYSFGPNGYCGLPGLILELQIRNGVYGVKRIDFNTKDSFDMRELKGIKIISQKKADDILKEQMREQ